MDGWAVAEAAAARNPRLPVIYVSANPVRRSRKVADSVFLGKPVDIRQLLEACDGWCGRLQHEMRAGRAGGVCCAAAPAPRSADSFRECPDCPEMVAIPAGKFLMGSPAHEPGRFDSEGPQHVVT